MRKYYDLSQYDPERMYGTLFQSTRSKQGKKKQESTQTANINFGELLELHPSIRPKVLDLTDWPNKEEEELVFSGFTICDIGIQSLVSKPILLHSLVRLDITNNRVSHFGFEILFEELLQCHKIRMLSASLNMLSDTNSDRVGKFLKKNTSLSSLDISNNLITPFFFLGRKMIEGIHQNSTLKTLYLQGLLECPNKHFKSGFKNLETDSNSLDQAFGKVFSKNASLKRIIFEGLPSEFNLLDFIKGLLCDNSVSKVIDIGKVPYLNDENLTEFSTFLSGKRNFNTLLLQGLKSLTSTDFIAFLHQKSHFELLKLRSFCEVDFQFFKILTAKQISFDRMDLNYNLFSGNENEFFNFLSSIHLKVLKLRATSIQDYHSLLFTLNNQTERMKKSKKNNEDASCFGITKLDLSYNSIGKKDELTGLVSLVSSNQKLRLLNLSSNPLKENGCWFLKEIYQKTKNRTKKLVLRLENVNIPNDQSMEFCLTLMKLRKRNVFVHIEGISNLSRLLSDLNKFSLFSAYFCRKDESKKNDSVLCELFSDLFPIAEDYL